ncbi:MAG: dihydrofolate reductase family protein [Nitrososphaerota archaeon]|nr:dihydrofolate reductase family protein [Nitrososphaerota archaeon]MDG7023064.1 dihydrofolate reductase family protein [Nitrososphaerota archaeon]
MPRKVLMIMFMTLDGVAEFPRYESGPASAAGPEADPMWSPRMEEIDTIFLGSAAYAKWAAFWPARKDDPSSDDWDREFSRFADRAEKVVFSKTLRSADWENSRIVRGDPADEVARLKRAKGKDMALGGGPRLAQSFLEEDLVDEMLLEVFPSIVGRGKPFFRVHGDPDNPKDAVPIGAPRRHDFRLLESRPLRDGTVFLHYARAGN